MTTKNRYIFETELTGFIKVDEDGGKFNNRTFAYTLPPAILEQAEADRAELLQWVDSKLENPKRVALNPEPWDEAGVVKYSYGGDSPKPVPPFIDTEGTLLEVEVLRDIRKGTKVKLIVQQSPYTKPSKGTTLKVLGVQVLELVTGHGAVDSGDLSAADVAALFGPAQGFKVSAPAVRQAPAAEDSYDF